jgi:hypothetical protein
LRRVARSSASKTIATTTPATRRTSVFGDFRDGGERGRDAFGSSAGKIFRSAAKKKFHAPSRGADALLDRMAATMTKCDDDRRNQFTLYLRGYPISSMHRRSCGRPIGIAKRQSGETRRPARAVPKSTRQKVFHLDSQPCLL